ncbi:hypothetical protein B0H11DRAFT_2311585 [Mycena galericulata]|nr:hypothetical protein B0H11DRAFT_2311585 [Mycena galericulata]
MHSGREQLVQTEIGDRERAVHLAAGKKVATWFELVLADDMRTEDAVIGAPGSNAMWWLDGQSLWLSPSPRLPPPSASSISCSTSTSATTTTPASTSWRIFELIRDRSPILGPSMHGRISREVGDDVRRDKKPKEQRGHKTSFARTPQRAHSPRAEPGVASPAHLPTPMPVLITPLPPSPMSNSPHESSAPRLHHPVLHPTLTAFVSHNALRDPANELGLVLCCRRRPTPEAALPSRKAGGGQGDDGDQDVAVVRQHGGPDPRFVIWGELISEREPDDVSTSQGSQTDGSSSAPSSSRLKKRSVRSGKGKSSTEMPMLKISLKDTMPKILVAAAIEQWIAQLMSDLNYDELLNFFLTYRTYISSKIMVISIKQVSAPTTPTAAGKNATAKGNGKGKTEATPFTPPSSAVLNSAAASSS